MPTLSVADGIAQFLKERGVRHIFGLPGGENVVLMDAFRRSGLHYILMHHEASAGFAAEVTGQLTDKPGVSLATLGPGAVNLLAAAAAATLERSPMLALTAEFDPEIQTRVTHMHLNLQEMFSSVTKASFALRADTALEALATAWRLALDPPRGAVHLAVSPETLQAPSGTDLPSSEHLRALEDHPADLDRVRELLQAANTIFIILGVGLDAASIPVKRLVAFAEAWNAPVAVTPKAKGHFPEDHPLFAGCFSAYGDAPLRRGLAESDVIFGVGFDGVDIVTATWDVPKPVVNVSAGGAADPVTRPEVAIDGNLSELIDKIQAYRNRSEDGDVRAKAIRAAIRQALDTRHPPVSGTIPVNQLIDALRRALPSHGLITLDVGVFKLVFLQAWHAPAPKRLFVANGLSAMGYAIPAALAVKLERPADPVVAVVGDGALLMYAGELETVARLRLPLVILVVVDKALALIRLKQLRHNVPTVGTEFGTTDYGSLASAFDLDYHLIDGPQGASKTLRRAILSRRPSLVEARVNVTEYDHFK